MALTLSISSGSSKEQARALYSLSTIDIMGGNFTEAQEHAHEAQRVAKISGDLYKEAGALRVESMSWSALGNYKQAITLVQRARDLLSLCGMSGGDADNSLMSTQAAIHMLKSEYMQGRKIQAQILNKIPVDQAPANYAFAVLNLAEIDIAVGAPEDDVQKNINAAKSIFTAMAYSTGLTMCDATLADLYLRDGNMLTAKPIFEKHLKVYWGGSAQITTYCLEKLGASSRWDAAHERSRWTTLFLVHSLKSKQMLSIYSALQFLGDVFLIEGDWVTARSLFAVALEAFTEMDVHRSRAECMIRLGDISKGQRDLNDAMKLWSAAKPLLDQSSQTQQIIMVDEKLLALTRDESEKVAKDLVLLSALQVPSNVDLGTTVGATARVLGLDDGESPVPVAL
jgi:tetratricopeptide (TPR) repeat protein